MANYYTQKERSKRCNELNARIEEFCVVCLKPMGFPKATPVDAPIRFKDGANYNEGGQACGNCNREMARKGSSS